MKEYRWEDIQMGLTHEFTASFTAEDCAAFAKLSGDVNPLHVDADYAVSAGFPSPVLFGMMTSSLYSQLVGVYMPGKYALLQGMDLDFNSPVHAGDALHVSGKVVFVNEVYRRFEIKARIRKADGKLVSKALIRVGFHVN